jgi:hypothetical protein
VCAPSLDGLELDPEPLSPPLRDEVGEPLLRAPPADVSAEVLVGVVTPELGPWPESDWAVTVPDPGLPLPGSRPSPLSFRSGEPLVWRAGPPSPELVGEAGPRLLTTSSPEPSPRVDDG